MGKNYDQYTHALDMQDQARDRLAAANGGSTQQEASAARSGALKADADVAKAWDKVMEDPEG
jgi:hypothetical protein